MYNLKNFLIAVWISVKTHVGKASKFVTDFESFKIQHENISKAKDCLFRTKNAYYALSGFSVHNLITAHAVDELVRTCRNYDELAAELDNTSARDDKLYCFLLIIAIGEVYKSSKPPELNGNFTPRLK
jgi:hypothetical protein